jgi:RHS repeat-associated protein
MKRFTLILCVCFGSILSLSLALALASNSGGEKAASNNGASKKLVAVAAIQMPTVEAGQSATLLPDGRWLLIGGEAQGGPLDTAAIQDIRTGAITPVANRLQTPRAWHSATLLPDGTILILGGLDARGQVLTSAEVFDPETQRFETLPATGLTARAYHTATLLTDGVVLIAGGMGQGNKLQNRLELWNPRTKASSTLPVKLHSLRSRHSAILQPDGSVLLWAGVNADAANAADGELYDPETGLLSWVGTLNKYEDQNPPYLQASLPRDGTLDVPIDSRIALRFSKSLRVNTVNSQSMVFSGPQGELKARVIPAEGGMLAFITPNERLLERTTYTITLFGASDESNRALPYASMSFTTAGSSSDQANDGETWVPDARNMRGDWRSHRPDSQWQKLPPLQAAPGVTALAGQVLLLNGNPLANVTLNIGDRTALTDNTGRFLLADLPPGHQVMKLDGRSASSQKKVYGVFRIGVEITADRTNVLPYTNWMPRTDVEHLTTFPTPTTSDTSITTPFIPGLEVHVPQGAIVRDSDGQTVSQLSITPIPVDRPPFPLPPNVIVPVFFTVQPGAARVIPPRAHVVYPNYTSAQPGTRLSFWNYDPESKGWYVYGQGTVSADGRQVVPDAGVVIYEFDGFMIGNGGNPPGSGPPAGNNADDGEPVDLSSGLFVYRQTDLVVGDVIPLKVERTYRPQDSVSRGFGLGSMLNYDMYLYSINNYQDADLVLPDGGRIHYIRISPGTSFTDAVYEHTTTPTSFYKSQLFWNSSEGDWNIKLKDGTVYVFGESSPGSFSAAVLTVRDRLGNQIHITRSNGAAGNATHITSPNGRFIDLSYDPSNRITQIKDNIGRTVNYTYDASGRLSRVTDPKGGTTDYTYDSANRMLTIKDPRLITYLTNQYDANGRVFKQTLADNSTFTFAYTTDAGGKVTQTDVTDQRGIVRRVTFNANGYTLTDTNALGKPEQRTTTFELQAGSSLPLSVTDPLGRRTVYAYDTSGNITDITRLAGSAQAVTTHFTYEPTYDQLASITDPLSHTWVFGYDAGGNLISVTDPLSHQTTISYNTAGQPITVADPIGNTTQLAYEFGDLVRITDPLGRTITRFVDNAGRMLSLTGPAGQLARYEYDALNRVTKVTDPLGGATSFTYDASGNPLTFQDARNNVTTYTYDNMDRLASRKDPLLKTETYNYDPAGNLIKLTDRRGKVTNYSYDNLNRPTFIGFGATGSHTITYESTITYTYDAVNRLTRAVDSIAGTTDRTYDNLDRLLAELTPQGTVSYGYDAANRQTSMTIAGQPVINYAYDAANRLIGLTQGAASISFSYDNANRRTRLTLPNGVATEYGYDAASQLTALTYKLGPNLIGDITYGYDQAGRRTQIGGSLTRVGLPQTLTTTTYNAANQLTQKGSSSLTYDANGNLTSDGVNTYTWDARNQLATIAGSVNASFKYDALGRRINKTVGSTGTNYLYDGLNAVQELSGTTPTSNMLTDKLDEVFSRTDASGTRSLLLDGLGSTVALTDASGAIQTQYTYDAFGNTTTSGAASGNVSQYTARENDGTGLYFYRNRYYSPTLQRFISQDPAGLGGGANFYAYVGNNPTNMRDPLGLWAGIDDLIFAGGGALVGIAGQGIGDLISGNLSGWEDYTGAAIGGAAGGEALLYTGPVGAGAIGGAVTNLTKQGLKNLSGKQCGFDGKSFVFDTGVGAATGFIPGARVPGVTSGRNSYNAIYKQMVTKFENGTISDVSAGTAAKMFAGRAVDKALVPGTGAAAAAGVGGAGYFSSERNCPCR